MHEQQGFSPPVRARWPEGTMGGIAPQARTGPKSTPSQRQYITYPKKILRLQIAITAICSLKICQIALNESVKDRNVYKKSGYHVVFLCFVESCKKIEKTHRVSAQLCVIVLMNSGHNEYAKRNEDKKTVEISQG